MSRGRRRDLDELISREREQFKAKLNTEQKQISRGFERVEQARKERKVHSTTNHYSKYVQKLKEERYEDFTSRDILFFFKDYTKKEGINFYSNLQQDIKYMANINQARKTYSNQELLGIIQFIFISDQDYLDKRKVSPSILCSTWMNTLYADASDFANGEYVPKSKRKKVFSNNKVEKFKEEREWQGSTVVNEQSNIKKWR